MVTELGELFPSIPLVAEEDSAFLRSNDLVNSVVSVVSDKAASRDVPLTEDDVLEAIDRGGKDAFVFGPMPATYWVSLSRLLTKTCIMYLHILLLVTISFPLETFTL